MKTKEQIKQEVLNYLTKTSLHAFAYPDGKLFKVIKEGDKFYSIDESSTYRKFKEIDIDSELNYGNNAKSILKHRFFLNKDLKSIRNTKYIRENVKNLYDLLKK